MRAKWKCLMFIATKNSSFLAEIIPCIRNFGAWAHIKFHFIPHFEFYIFQSSIAINWVFDVRSRTTHTPVLLSFISNVSIKSVRTNTLARRTGTFILWEQGRTVGGRLQTMFHFTLNARMMYSIFSATTSVHSTQHPECVRVCVRVCICFCCPLLKTPLFLRR